MESGLNWNIFGNILAAIIASATFVEITPIKINPLGWLFKKINKEANAERDEELKAQFDKLEKNVKKVDDKITALEKKVGDNETTLNRKRILRFSDEITHGVVHSKEHFDDVLDDIKAYELYCTTHPSYPNTKAIVAIKLIKETYEECYKKGKLS